MADNSGTTLYYNTDKGRIGVPADVPSDQIREYFASEGLSPEAIDAAMSKPETAGLMDRIPDSVKGLFPYGKAIATGAGKAIPHVFDAASMLGDYLNKGIDAGVGAVTGKEAEPAPPLPNLTDAAGKAIGGWHEPQSRTESVLEAAGEGAVGGLAGPGGWLSKLMLYGALPGAASEAAGQAAHELPGSDYTEGPTRMLTSMFAPGAARKILTPNTVDDVARLAANARLDKALRGVQTAGQFTNDERQMERELVSDPKLNDKQSAKFMKAVTKPAGEEATDVTAGHPSSYIDRGMTRASNDIERVANQTHIDPNATGPIKPIRPQTAGGTQPQVYDDLVDIQQSARNTPQYQKDVLDLFKRVNKNWVPNNHALPGAEEYHGALFGTPNPNWVTAGNAIKGGGTRQITGQEYQKLRTALHSEAENAPTGYAYHLRNVADALDNAMENTLHVKQPNLVNDWQKARNQYKNMLVMEKASGSSGADRFTPDQVEAASKSVQGTRPFLRGQTDYGWMRDAKKALPPLEASKLPPQQLIPTGAGGLLGGGLGIGAHMLLGGHGLGYSAEHSIYPLLMGEAGAQVWNKRNMLPQMNPAVQAYKKNQAFPLLPQERGQRINSQMLRALMENQRQQQ